jgi:ABC-type lipoprotein release transport system permease subunit
VLLPYVAALGVSRGLLGQAEQALRHGPELTVSGHRLGRPAPLPLAAVDRIRAIPGVTSVSPRIVGEIKLGRARHPAVLVGVPPDRLPPTAACVEGRLWRPGAANELVLGQQLARRLGLTVGSTIPPFYENPAGDRLSVVVGLFRADAAVWEANVVFASLETAAAVFAQRDLVTDVLVSCAPGATEDVRQGVLRLGSLGEDAHGPIRPRVVAREDAEALVSAGLLHREGVLGLHFLLAFAVGIPLVLVTSGIGLSERRRETGLLKALGWRTDEVLLQAGVESALLAILATSAAVVLAALWLGPLGARGIADVFLGGSDATPVYDLPFRLAPVPVVLAAALAVAVIATGTLLSTWRVASAPPAEALR